VWKRRWCRSDGRPPDSLRTGKITGNFQFFVSFGRGGRRAGVPACSLGRAGSAFLRPGERREPPECPSRILPALTAGPRRRRPGCGRSAWTSALRPGLLRRGRTPRRCPLSQAGVTEGVRAAGGAAAFSACGALTARVFPSPSSGRVAERKRGRVGFCKRGALCRGEDPTPALPEDGEGEESGSSFPPSLALTAGGAAGSRSASLLSLQVSIPSACCRAGSPSSAPPAS